MYEFDDTKVNKIMVGGGEGNVRGSVLGYVEGDWDQAGVQEDRKKADYGPC